MRDNPISATVNFEADGLHHGFLKLPHSHDGSAWGSLMIPITVCKRGDGPTALLSGGNHGDEYEGPIALFDLAKTIDPGQVSGRVIIVPAMNYPAFRAGTRTSPIDGGNMNRVFPGRPDGTVTEKIADYFQRRLLPMADVVLDLHSGGKTLAFVPFAAAHVLADKAQEARCMAAMEAFAAPYSVQLMEIDSAGMYDTAAEEMGKVFVSTELGGGGTATAATIGIAKRGLSNLLRHVGILAGQAESRPTIRLHTPGTDCFITSESVGLVEFCAELGQDLRKGDLVARIHDVERTGRAALNYRANLDGLLIGRHFPGLIAMGDVIAVVAASSSG
jgi:N-alpha-acetyl-L-2,4-diaminobutyrate deacetylase